MSLVCLLPGNLDSAVKFLIFFFGMDPVCDSRA